MWGFLDLEHGCSHQPRPVFSLVPRSPSSSRDSVLHLDPRLDFLSTLNSHCGSAGKGDHWVTTGNHSWPEPGLTSLPLLFPP